MTERLLTTQEVADYLGVPVATLYRWRTAGKRRAAQLARR